MWKMHLHINQNPMMMMMMIDDDDLCEDGIKKSVHPDHHLSSLYKPLDAKR